MLARPLLGFLTISVAVEMKIILIIIIFTKKMSSALLQFNAHPWLPDIYIYIYIYRLELQIGDSALLQPRHHRCWTLGRNNELSTLFFFASLSSSSLSVSHWFNWLVFPPPPPPATHHPPPTTPCCCIYVSFWSYYYSKQKKKYLHERDQRRKRQFVRRFRVIEFCEPAQLTPDPMYCCVVEAIIFCLLVSVSINNKNAVSYTNLPPCPPLSSAKKKTFGPIFERKINKKNMNI